MNGTKDLRKRPEKKEVEMRTVRRKEPDIRHMFGAKIDGVKGLVKAVYRIMYEVIQIKDLRRKTGNMLTDNMWKALQDQNETEVEEIAMTAAPRVRMRLEKEQLKEVDNDVTGRDAIKYVIQAMYQIDPALPGNIRGWQETVH